jgi:hypothetical protein
VAMKICFVKAAALGNEIFFHKIRSFL